MAGPVENFMSVEKLFEELSVTDVHKYLSNLKNQLYIKEEDLQSLVVSKYPSLLNAADKMEDIEEKMDNLNTNAKVIIEKYHETFRAYSPGELSNIQNVTNMDILENLQSICDCIPCIVLHCANNELSEASLMLVETERKLNYLLKHYPSSEMTCKLQDFLNNFSLKSIINASIEQSIKCPNLSKNKDKLKDALRALIINEDLNGSELIRRYLSIRSLKECLPPKEIAVYYTDTVTGIKSVENEFPGLDDTIIQRELEFWRQNETRKLESVISRSCSKIENIDELDLQIGDNEFINDIIQKCICERFEFILLTQTQRLLENIKQELNRKSEGKNDIWENDDFKLSNFCPFLSESIDFLLLASKPLNNDRLGRSEIPGRVMVAVLNLMKSVKSGPVNRWFVIEELKRLQDSSSLDLLQAECEKEWLKDYIQSNPMYFYFLKRGIHSSEIIVESQMEETDIVIPANISSCLLDYLFKFTMAFDREFFGRPPRTETVNALLQHYASMVANELEQQKGKPQFWFRQLLFDILFIEACYTDDQISDIREKCVLLLDPVDWVLIQKRLQQQVYIACQSLHMLIGKTESVTEEDWKVKSILPVVDPTVPLDFVPFDRN